MVRDLALDMNISRASQLQYTIPDSGVACKFRECGFAASISASRMVLSLRKLLLAVANAWANEWRKIQFLIGLLSSVRQFAGSGVD
jgi:hypothetical protein